MAQCLEFFGSNLVAHTTVNLSCMKKCYEAKCTASTSSNSLRQSQYKAPAFHSYPWQSLTIFWRTTQPQQSLQFPGSTLELFVGVCRPVIESSPYFRAKRAIFHTRFHTWPLKSKPVFRPLASMPKSKEVEANKKTGKILPNAILCLLIFLSHSFGEEKLNSFTLSRGSLEYRAQFQTIMVKIYTHFQTNTTQKPYPLGRHISLQVISHVNDTLVV